MSWSGLPQQLEDKIMPEPNSGCWLWIGAWSSKEYGSVKDGIQTRGAHRVVYEHLVGPVDPNLALDHFHCELPCCVNPEHLRPVTDQENTLRGRTTIARKYADRTHCKNGHLLVGENVLSEPRSRARVCKICKNTVTKRWRQANKKKVVGYSLAWRERNLERHKTYQKEYGKRRRAKAKC